MNKIKDFLTKSGIDINFFNKFVNYEKVIELDKTMTIKQAYLSRDNAESGLSVITILREAKDLLASDLSFRADIYAYINSEEEMLHKTLNVSTSNIKDALLLRAMIVSFENIYIRKGTFINDNTEIILNLFQAYDDMIKSHSNTNTRVMYQLITSTPFPEFDSGEYNFKGHFEYVGPMKMDFYQESPTIYDNIREVDTLMLEKSLIQLMTFIRDEHTTVIESNFFIDADYQALHTILTQHKDYKEISIYYWREIAELKYEVSLITMNMTESESVRLNIDYKRIHSDFARKFKRLIKSDNLKENKINSINNLVDKVSHGLYGGAGNLFVNSENANKFIGAVMSFEN